MRSTYTPQGSKFIISTIAFAFVLYNDASENPNVGYAALCKILFLTASIYSFLLITKEDLLERSTLVKSICILTFFITDI